MAGLFALMLEIAVPLKTQISVEIDCALFKGVAVKSVDPVHSTLHEGGVGESSLSGAILRQQCSRLLSQSLIP